MLESLKPMMLTDNSPQSFGRNGRMVEWSRERMGQWEKRVYGVPRRSENGLSSVDRR